MKFKFLSLKLKTGDLSDKGDWNYNSVDISVPQEDNTLFDNIGRVIKNSEPVKANTKIEANNEEVEREIENIRKEILTENVDGIAKDMINDWSSGNDKSLKKTAIREFVTSSFNDLENNREEIRSKNLSHHNTTRKILYYSSVAAAVFIGILVLKGSLSDTMDPETLFSRYYEPFNLISSTTRGPNSNIENITSDAIELYNNGKYNEAIAGFTEVLENNPGSYSTIFYLGIAELATGDARDAVGSLEKVMQNQGVFSAEATWYLGLAYLKSGNEKKAADCFVKLTENPGYYVRESEKILRRLR